MEIIQTSEVPKKDFKPKTEAESLGRKYSLIFFNIFNRYHFFVTTNGQFVDSVTKQRVHVNHVKCLLRNDYLSGTPEIHGSLLNGIIDRFLIGLVKAVKVAAVSHPEYVHEEDVKDEYLT